MVFLNRSIAELDGVERREPRQGAGVERIHRWPLNL